MIDYQCAVPTTYHDPDFLRSSLMSSMVDWEVRSTQSTPFMIRVAPVHVGGVRLMDISGNPSGAARGSLEIGKDDRAYLGVLFQLTGHTVCAQRGGQAIVAPGDVAIWHSERPTVLDMPEPFRKLCMMIPIEQFESALPNAESYEGLHMKAGSSRAMLLGGWLKTLIDDVVTNDQAPMAPGIDMTVDVLGMAMAESLRQRDDRPRTNLFERAIKLIDQRLAEPDLTPNTIARNLNISLRYLHLLFSERGMTVAGWIKSRRLAKCRAELADRLSDRSITEIAFTWGFSDSAYFSRLFKSTYGLSPREFRRNGQGDGR